MSSSFIRRKELPSGRIRYYVFIEWNGKEKSLGGFDRKRDAEARLRRAREELALGTFDRIDETFAQFATRWLKEDIEPTVRLLTYKDYEAMLRNHLLPSLGPVKLHDIKPEHVRHCIVEMSEKGLAPRTCNKVLMVCKMMLGRAEELERIPKNPASKVRAFRQPQTEMEFLNVSELRRLLDAASPKAYPIIATAALSGVRQGELLALRWSDVDLEEGILYVRRSYRPETGFTEPKSKAGRRAIRICEELCIILFLTKQEQAATNDNLLFPSKTGTPLDHANLVVREFHPALARAGLRRIRWHDLRHTYAALMISLDTNMKVLQSWMGHSSIRVTMDSYGHLLPEAHDGIQAKLGGLIFD